MANRLVPSWLFKCMLGLLLFIIIPLSIAEDERFSNPDPFAHNIPGLPALSVGGNYFKLNKQLSQKAAPSSYEKYFNQTTDQFNYKGKYHYENYREHFPQRYFVNTQWRNSNYGNVHILYVEGENIASETMVTDTTLPHVALAKDMGATVWSLEHRFRGKSQPFRRTFHNNYADYLSVGAAVEDVKTFINATNVNLGLSNPKWVVFGSDYGGVVALWFRQKYPQYSVGAVVESAPVKPMVDFHTYEKFVEEVYSNYSYECWHGIKFSALAIRNVLQYSEGVDLINRELKMRPRISTYRMDYKNYQHMHHSILSLFDTPVLMNKVNVGPFASCCGVDDLCKIMSDETTKDVHRVFNLAKLIYTNTHGSKDEWPGMDNDFARMVKWLNNTRHTPYDIVQPSARSWLWQLCHEFGQFVTTDSGFGLFRATVPNDYYISICTDAFEAKVYSFTVRNLKQGIKDTVRRYPTSQTYNGTNTLIFNGGLDPYQLLASNAVTDSSSTIVNVAGVGHAAVFKPPHSNDPDSLKDARNKILYPTAKKWIRSGGSQRAKKETKESTAKKTTTTEQKASTGQKLKRSVTKLFDEHTVVRPTFFPSDEEIKMNKYFPLPGRSIHQQMDKFIRQRAREASSTGQNFTVNLEEESKFAGDRIKPIREQKSTSTKAGYIEQDLDHFDENSDLVFKQRYFKNAIFKQDHDAPRFMMLGGEAPLNDFYVDDDYLHYFRWAKDFRAVVYALEHRFIGYSSPFSNTSLYILQQYLTTEQVLADTAVFVQTMNKLEANPNPRWVVFGGGYAGNLVAAFRTKYPQLSLGAVASSAPMEAKTDFHEYMEKLEDDIKLYGQKYCANGIRGFFHFIRMMLNYRYGRVYLKNIFCLNNRWDENYIDENEASYFPIEQIQIIDELLEDDSENHRRLQNACYRYYRFTYYYDGGQHHRTRKIESKLRKAVKELVEHSSTGEGKTEKRRRRKRAAEDDLYQYEDEDSDNYTDYDDSLQTSYDDRLEGTPEELCPRYCYERCQKVSYNGHLERLENVYRKCWNDYYCSDQSRIWLWLQCSAWGFMPSTNYGYNIFASSQPINYNLNLCTDVFGPQYNRSYVEAAVARTNNEYGGSENYKGTNIIFVNGSEDPWGELSVYSAPAEQNVTSIVIDGVSHCVDMRRENVHDAQVIKDARKQIKKQIVRWVRRPNLVIGDGMGEEHENPE
jgi:pimeloyl-ACP methyl ester carboxylesterase